MGNYQIAGPNAGSGVEWETWEEYRSDLHRQLDRALYNLQETGCDQRGKLGVGNGHPGVTVFKRLAWREVKRGSERRTPL